MGADVTTGGDNRRLSNLVAVSVVISTGSSCVRVPMTWGWRTS